MLSHVIAGLALATTAQVNTGVINQFSMPVWGQYGGNPQHTALSQYASKPMQSILWAAPVDYSPQYSGNDLLTHYGSPLVTRLGTIIVPAKTGPNDGFEFDAYAPDGTPKWFLSTDYSLPPHSWVPPCDGCLNLGQAYLVVPGAAGSLWLLQKPDAPTQQPAQIAYYGIANYTGASTMDKADLVSKIKICTPLMTSNDSYIYFGVRAVQPNPLNLESGFVQEPPTKGPGNFVSARAASGDPNIKAPVMACVPALSNDGQYLYVVVNSGDFGYGYLLCLSTHDLHTVSKVRLKDPNGNDALLPDSGTASPMVGPDGDVYFGVLENPFPSNHARGWLLHFNSDLKIRKTPGPFGWDDTPSVVPSKLVGGYIGPSPYLILTKYNNYAGAGGDGINRVGIFDPNQTMVDSVSGRTTMKAIISVKGPTPDAEFTGTLPNAVREWCINSAAIDPVNACAIINSEDGKCYRWNLKSNTLDMSQTLTSGVGEAYTPTIIGPIGMSFAINNGVLFALGVPLP